MGYFELILSPIIWLMRWVLDFYVFLTSSTGLSILLVGFTFTLLLIPLRKKAQVIERRVSAKTREVNEKIKPLKGKLKGELLFKETEKIYQKHNYHPIQSIGLGASFFVMLPVLISAVFLFTGEILVGKDFLFIKDLSKPDHLLGPVNLLPLFMTGVTVVDARIRFKNDKASQSRFYAIAAVLLLLVYNLSAGLILYWTACNFMSMVLSIFDKK